VQRSLNAKLILAVVIPLGLSMPAFALLTIRNDKDHLGHLAEGFNNVSLTLKERLWI
jgi:hypothetical protein